MAVGPGRRKRAESKYKEQAARLAAVLRDQRLTAELTQEQVAIRAGIPLSTLRKIETGQVVEPCYFAVVELLQALGLPTNELPEQGAVVAAEGWSSDVLGDRRAEQTGMAAKSPAFQPLHYKA